MRSLALLLVLLVLPLAQVARAGPSAAELPEPAPTSLRAPVSARGPARVPAAASAGLAARCLWAERGWRTEVVGLDHAGEADAVGAAAEAFGEHRRLHGWGPLDGPAHRAVVTEPATCPPAALSELLRRGDAGAGVDPTAGSVALRREVALVYARNGLVEHALDELEALRPSPAPDAPLDPGYAEAARIDRERARILADAGRFERALAVLDGYRPVAGPERELFALEEEADLLRGRCWLRLGRVEELEALALAHLVPGAAPAVRAPRSSGPGGGASASRPSGPGSRGDRGCEWIELLLAARERAGLEGGRDELLAPVLARYAGRPVLPALVARMDELWETALRHRRLLALDPSRAFPRAAGLLDRGDHRRDVLELLSGADAGALDALLELATRLPADDPRTERLWDVLAATGDPRVRAPLEDRSGVRPAAGRAAELAATWQRAAALREGLSAPR